ncbi:unnamed protein product, partial [Polarella glacialis]
RGGQRWHCNCQVPDQVRATIRDFGCAVEGRPTVDHIYGGRGWREEAPREVPCCFAWGRRQDLLGQCHSAGSAAECDQLVQVLLCICPSGSAERAGRLGPDVGWETTQHRHQCYSLPQA